MQLTVKGKQLDVGDALRVHVEDSLNAVAEKYFTNPIDATVVFSREAHLYRADVSVHVGRNIMLQGNAAAEGPYVAFDQAADRVGKRLRRYKRRLKDHHKNGSADKAIPAQAYVLQAEPEELPDHIEEPTEHVVIAEMTTAVETLTVSEAVMRLDLAGLPALMFRNGAHGGLNMIYRRGDGNIGWVDPQGSPEAGV
ncbi:MAG: ribosome-associated translation inhibitor RaiA [Alphaproteobacteria bacterium]